MGPEFDGIAHLAENGSSLPTILFVLAIIAIFYFLIIRPQSKRRKEHRALTSSLSRGDEIITAGGIMGTILQVQDDWIQLEISKGTSLRLQRGSVTATLPKGTLKDMGN